jgi:hypothetical protein
MIGAKDKDTIYSAEHRSRKHYQILIIKSVSIDIDCGHSPGLATIRGLQATGASFSENEGVAKRRISGVQNDYG